MIEISQHLWWRWVLPAALQATPLLLLAAGLDLLLPRLLDPRWRAAVWLLAAAKLVLPFRTVAPAWGLLPNWAQIVDPPAMWTTVIPAMWLFGVVTLSSGSVWWFLRQRAKLIPAIAAPPGIREIFIRVAGELNAPHAILESTAAIKGPVVVGRTVYWPCELHLHLSAEEQAQALRHEICHIRRGDSWRDPAAAAAARTSKRRP